MSELQIPLFPLNTVLFPGGPLPLRIFEPRYLDMVSACMKHDTGFGVCLIRAGREIGAAATPYDIGTLAEIMDWHRRPDGLLGITVIGRRRFHVDTVTVQPDQLALAQITLLPDEPQCAVPQTYLPMAQSLQRILEQIGQPYADLPRHYDNACWVGYRLAELLPIDLLQKQYFLQLDDPLQRLQRLQEVLKGLGML